MTNSNSELRLEDYFDIDKIKKSRIKSISTDMRAFISTLGFGSPFSLEGELLFKETKEISTIKELRKNLSKLGFEQWQVKENDSQIIILYVDFWKNTEVITNEMKYFGWECIDISESVEIHGGKCRIMDFIPTKQKI